MIHLRFSHETISLSISSDLIICRYRAIKQPALLDFCDIPDKCLASSFEDLVKDDPVRLPVLLFVSIFFRNLLGKVDLQT